MVAALLAGVLVGPVSIGAGDILRSGLARLPFLDVSSPLSAPQEAIVWEIRVPRVALGALVGAMLALAGTSYQGVFRNPLADPYLLGVAAGAGLGATLAIAYGAGARRARARSPPSAARSPRSWARGRSAAPSAGRGRRRRSSSRASRSRRS